MYSGSSGDVLVGAAAGAGGGGGSGGAGGGDDSASSSFDVTAGVANGCATRIGGGWASRATSPRGGGAGGSLSDSGPPVNSGPPPGPLLLGLPAPLALVPVLGAHQGGANMGNRNKGGNRRHREATVASAAPCRPLPPLPPLAPRCRRGDQNALTLL